MSERALADFVTRWQAYAARRFPAACLDEAVETLREALATIDTQVSRPLELLALGGALSAKQRDTIVGQREAVSRLATAAEVAEVSDAAARATLEALRAYVRALSDTLALAAEALSA